MSSTVEPRQDQLVAYARDLASAYELLQTQNELLPVALDPKDLRQEAPRACHIAVLVANFPAIPALLEDQTNDLATILQRLNEHLALVVEAVQACEGTVEKFAGSGLVATFGARRDLPAPCQLAVAAAVALVGASARFNRENGNRHWLDVGVGIAAGQAVVGHLGPRHRWEMGVLGDCVNVAAQLAARAPALEILIDEDAYLAVQSAIRAKQAGLTSVVGRTSRVTTYSIKPVDL